MPKGRHGGSDEIMLDPIEEASFPGEVRMTVLRIVPPEPWGVRRFYVRDPFGRIVNILEHR